MHITLSLAAHAHSNTLHASYTEYKPCVEIASWNAMDLTFNAGLDTYFTSQTRDEFYTYDSLDHSSSQIRLLTLFPSCDKRAPLRGQLIITDVLPQPPPYEALSYVWRDADDISLISEVSMPEPLHIDGKVLRISWNLSWILLQIRHNYNSRTLWIDAVCIDQGSDSEKNHQVRQMYHIYSLAHRVLIWLGERGLDEDSDPAGVRGIRQRKYHHRDEQLIASFSSRQWWRRVWTLQEGLAAQWNSVILCGHNEYHWQDFVKALAHYLQSDRETLAHLVAGSPSLLSALLAGPDEEARVRSATMALDYFIHVYNMRVVSSEVTLEELVFASKIREASDPRDHIYALLGLVKGSHIALFNPDYSKPTTWVFQMASMHILEIRMDLDFVVLALNQDLPNQPSWCVDFSRKDKLESLDALQWFRRYGTIEKGVSSGRRLTELKHCIDEGTLTLRGTCVGKIASTRILSIPNKTEQDRAEQVSSLLELMRPLSHWVRNSWDAHLGFERARLKSSNGDIWRLVANGRQIEELLGAVPNIEHPFSALSQFEDWDVNPSVQQYNPSTESNFVIAWDAYLKVVELCDDRLLRLFITDTGYTGSGYAGIAEGDIVAILWGCKLPLVMRPKDNGTYTLVDAVYVDEIMNGEYFTTSEDRVEMEFTLR